jgi:GT2 family glycosyltransferase
VVDCPTVAIVILNWNGWLDTINCLKSLNNIKYKNYYTIIVDNNSIDESIQKIRDYYRDTCGLTSKNFHNLLEYTKKEAEFGGGREEEIVNLPSNKRLIMIKNDKNLGFAGGNNVGINYSLNVLSPKYILLLNNDTFVDEFFLDKLVESIDQDDEIGSVQSLLLKPGGNQIDSLGQSLLCSGAKDIEIGSIYRGGLVKTEVFGPCAAAALYRSKALEDAGPFDESFFVMFEDVDLSWRIRMKGYSSFLIPSSIVYHKRGVSERWQTSGTKSRIIRYYTIKNWLMVAIRYYPSPQNQYMLRLFIHYLVWCLIYAISLGRLRESIGQICASLIIRKDMRKDKIWKDLQSRWIQQISCDSTSISAK